MLLRRSRVVLLVGVSTALSGATAVAQDTVYDVYVDTGVSSSACDVVNAANTELAVISATGELQVLGGEIIPGSFVGAFQAGSAPVSIGLDPVGVLQFADDADGLRTLWWLSLTGFVIRVDDFTLEPEPTTLFPTDFGNVPCDVCTIIEDPVACPECVDDFDCEDGNLCTDDFCDAGICVSVDNRVACDDGDPCTDFDECFEGVCAGVGSVECDPGPIDVGDGDVIVDDGVGGGGTTVSAPRLSFSFCGSGASLSMCLTLLGLSLMQLTRRRP